MVKARHISMLKLDRTLTMLLCIFWTFLSCSFKYCKCCLKAFSWEFVLFLSMFNYIKLIWSVASTTILLFWSMVSMMGVKIDDLFLLTLMLVRVVPTSFVGGLFPLIGVLWVGKLERLITSRCWIWVNPTNYEYSFKLITLLGLNLALRPWLNFWKSWFYSRTKSSPQSFSLNNQIVGANGPIGKLFSNYSFTS